jgi:hypothetical protein
MDAIFPQNPTPEGIIEIDNHDLHGISWLQYLITLEDIMPDCVQELSGLKLTRLAERLARRMQPPAIMLEVEISRDRPMT